MPEYRDNNGRSVLLQQELGRGGEGRVCSVAGDPEKVAKIYHPKIAASRRGKLELMSALASPKLEEFACWPLALLYDTNHQFAGYLMANLAQWAPIHELYSPKSRRNAFPRANYRFLVHTATNIARAFAAAHEAAIVIGDVNQNSVMVHSNGTVRLIDCDSFQVAAKGRIYKCEVGVPLYTPPELQGREFSQIQRSEQDDLFGLAILIFQLLCMGKHPFAGRYLRSEEMPISRAIAERRFPYLASSTDFLPPPDGVHLGWLAPCDELFTSAFMSGARASALHWISALGTFAKSLESCSVNPAHQFPSKAKICPWCAIESRTGAILFGITVVTRQGSSIDIDSLWGRITYVASPSRFSLPPATQAGRPTSDALRVARTVRNRRLIAHSAAILVTAILAVLAPEVTPLSIVLFILAEAWARRYGKPLKAKRETELTEAQRKMEGLKKSWLSEASNLAFDASSKNCTVSTRTRRSFRRRRQKRCETFNQKYAIVS